MFPINNKTRKFSICISFFWYQIYTLDKQITNCTIVEKREEKKGKKSMLSGKQEKCCCTHHVRPYIHKRISTSQIKSLLPSYLCYVSYRTTEWRLFHVDMRNKESERRKCVGYAYIGRWMVIYIPWLITMTKIELEQGIS